MKIIILFSSLLIKSLLAILYVRPPSPDSSDSPSHPTEIEIQMPSNQENISMRQLDDIITIKNNLPLTCLEYLHFDKATSPMEILCLPFAFFDQIMFPFQLTEIILNDCFGPVLRNDYLQREGRALGSRRDRRELRRKIKAIWRKLDTLSPEVLGPQQDAVMARIPPKLYRYINPLTALLSNTFEASVRGFLYLLNVTARTLTSLVQSARDALFATLRILSRIGVTPLRVMQVTSALLGLMAMSPALAVAAPRVYEVLTELQKLTSSMVSLLSVAEQVQSITVTPQ